MAPFSPEELHLARDVVDELLQRIVHHWAVADAYCDVTEDPVPYFCQLKAQASPATDADGEGVVDETVLAIERALEEETAVRERVAAMGDNPSDPVKLADVATEHDLQDGELQCLVEEVVEGLLFGMLTDESSDAPLRQALVASRGRSRGARANGGGRVVTLPDDDAVATPSASRSPKQ